jgi:hypothetical protein
MNSAKRLEPEHLPNTISETVDLSGEFKVITHCDEKGIRRSFPQRLDTRFRKGKSGNPKGRPRGSLSPATLLKEMFNASVAVRKGEKRQFMARADAMIRGTVADGLRGDARSLTTVMELLDMAGYLDQPIEEKRQWAPLILREPPRNLAEWQLLAPPAESERRRYLAMAEAEEAEQARNRSAQGDGSKSE